MREACQGVALRAASLLALPFILCYYNSERRAVVARMLMKEKPMNFDLRAWREWAGWSQRELARLADITPMTVSELERGRAVVSTSTLQGLAQAFGVTRVDLLHRTPAEMWAEGWRPPELAAEMEAAQDEKQAV